MSFSLVNRHVLEDHITGFETRPNPNHLAILRRPAVLSVLVHAGHEQAVAAQLQAIGEASARFAGPAEWLLVSDTVGAESLARTVSGFAEGAVSYADQSDGRVVMRLSGPSVRRILAKCTAVDVHADQFAVGRAANVLFCHVGANLSRVDADSFEIAVMRSFAGSVFHEVMEMGREFALTADFAA